MLYPRHARTALALVLLLSCGERERPPASAPGRAAIEPPRGAASPKETPAAAVVVAAPRVSGIRISIKNPLPSGRSTETVAIRLSDVHALLPSLQEAKSVVVDASGRAVLSQLVDSDGDERADELIFQTDLGPNGEKTFELGEGVRPTPSLDQFKVYGRFVRERHDDFAWENDRVAHRIYGPALETWQQEPLTSSGVDIWCKRTPRLVVNDWYQSEDYHRDNGDGGDFYSVGASRGCGGLGVWSDKQLHVSRNFTASRVLSNGPIRLIFELDYAPWDAGGGTRVSETRRVTVDAGKHFDRFESSFKVTGKSNGLALAVGIGKHSGGIFDDDRERGFLRSWEPLKGENGHVGCAVINASGPVAGFEETATDRLLLTSLVSGAPASYLAGFGWDKGGVADNAAWAALVEGAASELHSPVQVSLAKSGEPPRGAAMPWADRVVSGLIEQHPKGLTDTWEYDSGLVLKGMLAVWHKTHDAKYLDYVRLTVGRLLDESGNIRGYRAEDYNLDQVNMGKLLFTLLAQAKEEKDRERYRHALAALRDQLKRQPRTRDGLFWHKSIYPHQVWLDGVYMASPFLAQYALTFSEPAALTDVATQILLVEKHLRDPKTGLLYHGWDESRSQRWANPKTGTSSQFWGRSVGWYAMGVVDVLELMPENHPQRPALRALLERLSRAIMGVQDKRSGVWWQVLDAPGRAKNYEEPSASSMFVYALAKAVRLGLIERKAYEPKLAHAARGLLERFASFDQQGQFRLKNTCKVAGLGGNPYRDGSYDYYTSTEISDTDPKGIGAFILARVEAE